MSVVNRFNLLDEPWIPIVGRGLVSLKQVFTHSDYPEIGGNPIEKIALMKLLLAIAQSACTPEDEEKWKLLGSEGMASRCLDYLEKWRDSFWLYGEKPFLQMPEIRKAEIKEFGIALPVVASGNTTLITQWQKQKSLTDSNKALMITTLVSFAFGGKKTDKSVSLTEGYKKASGKPGPFLGYLGYLHNFLTGPNLLVSLWLNLLTSEQLKSYGYWPKGLGVAPWEKMPSGEDCSVAKELKESYLGRLVPLSRFCLFSDTGVHYSEGISLSSHKEGGVDPSIAIDRTKKEYKAAWVDPEKRPWRFITSFLSYLGARSSYDCIFINEGLKRIRENLPVFGIWSGGLRVSNNAGEQYVSGKDDFVESNTLLHSEAIGETWFSNVNAEMEFLDQLSKIVFQSVSGYFRSLKADGADHAGVAVNVFWQHCEKFSQDLFNFDCPKNLRKNFIAFAFNIYDQMCPKDTSRQLLSWVKNRPKINGKFNNKIGKL